MPWPTITVNAIDTLSATEKLLVATPDKSIENRYYPRRFYNFNMRLRTGFEFQDTSTLTLTDDAGTNQYHLIDRLGNPVRAEQISIYAQSCRTVASQFDSMTNTIRILSPLCPTDFYINTWLDAATAATNETNKSGVKVKYE